MGETTKISFLEDLLLATNTLLRPVYVPSEDNPADAPSRGRRRRAVHRHVLKKPGFCKAERALQFHPPDLRFANGGYCLTFRFPMEEDVVVPLERSIVEHAMDCSMADQYGPGVRGAIYSAFPVSCTKY